MCKFLFDGLTGKVNKQDDKAPGCFPAAEVVFYGAFYPEKTGDIHENAICTVPERKKIRVMKEKYRFLPYPVIPHLPMELCGVRV